MFKKSGKRYRVSCLERICKPIGLTALHITLMSPKRPKAKNELLIAIIWIARCGSTCLLKAFVHSFTPTWTAASTIASLFFFYFYPLSVNKKWLCASISSKLWKQSGVAGIRLHAPPGFLLHWMSNLTFDTSGQPANLLGFLLSLCANWKRGGHHFCRNNSWNANR